MNIFTKTASCQHCNNQHLPFDYYGFHKLRKILEKGQISDLRTILKGFLSIVSVMKYFCWHFNLEVSRAKHIGQRFFQRNHALSYPDNFGLWEVSKSVPSPWNWAQIIAGSIAYGMEQVKSLATAAFKLKSGKKWSHLQITMVNFGEDGAFHGQVMVPCISDNSVS